MNLKLLSSFQSTISLASEARYVLMLHLSHLDVWYLGDKHKYDNKLSKLVTIKYSKNDYVRCSAISPDGTWVVYSTEEKLKIFSLIMVCNIFLFVNHIYSFN